jgi:hypothetical protein
VISPELLLIGLKHFPSPKKCHSERSPEGAQPRNPRILQGARRGKLACARSHIQAQSCQPHLGSIPLKTSKISTADQFSSIS